MDRWDVLIAAVAGYVAVMTLVRLMTARRDELVSQIREHVAKERAAREAAAEADEQNAA